MAVLDAGNGSDGSATVSTSTNLSTNSVVGRPNADMPFFTVTSLSPTSCNISVSNPAGLAANDKVLLISTRGISGSEANVGNWEILEVSEIGNGYIGFKNPKVKNYGNTGGDTNIGTGSSNNWVQLIRIPQYQDLTINSGVTLSVNSYSGVLGGVFVIMVKGTLINNGTISMTGMGYRGLSGNNGESITGYGGWGSGGAYGTSYDRRAASGGYGTTGQNNWRGDGGGSAYGPSNLRTQIFMGGAGGAKTDWRAGPGGNSGGIVMIFATSLENYGTIVSNGVAGSGDAGKGSGGGILLQSGSAKYQGTINAINPTDPSGQGRIGVYYNYLDGDLANFYPTPYSLSDVTLPYKILGTVRVESEVRVYDTSWNFIISNTFPAGNWMFENLPSSGPFHLLALPGDGENIQAYRDVVALET